MPRIGMLRRHLTIEDAVDTADGAGGATRTYAVLGTAFAQVAAAGRRDTVSDGRAVGLVTHKVTLRQRSDVRRGVRFVDGAARYLVLAVEDDARRRFITCLCEEEQA